MYKQHYIDNSTPFVASGTGSTIATATVAAVSGKTHCITDVCVASDVANSTVTIYDGTTAKWQFYINDKSSIFSLETPIIGTKSAAVSITITGTGATRANLSGYTYA